MLMSHAHKSICSAMARVTWWGPRAVSCKYSSCNEEDEKPGGLVDRSALREFFWSAVAVQFVV